jgi:hypothetical protein
MSKKNPRDGAASLKPEAGRTFGSTACAPEIIDPALERQRESVRQQFFKTPDVSSLKPETGRTFVSRTCAPEVINPAVEQRRQDSLWQRIFRHTPGGAPKRPR